MRHAEARELLPAYALGAIEDEGKDSTYAELESHLRGCKTCRAELATYLDSAASMADAVPSLQPPPSARAALRAEASRRVRLAHRVARQSDSRISGGWWRQIWRPVNIGLIAVAVALAAGLVIWDLTRRLDAASSELALDDRGLALLTSTETTVVRLEPVSGGSTQAHGHWYHRPGIDTQVLVAESMSPAPVGESYYGWLQLADGTWRSAGPFTLNRDGYGRIILLGSDGSDVRAVVVTLQGASGSGPPGDVILRWHSP